MPRRKKPWSFDKSKEVWLGHFHNKRKANGRATRRQIATYKQCPEENYDFLMAQWRLKQHEMELDDNRKELTRLKPALEEWLNHVKTYRHRRTHELYARTASRLIEAMGNPMLSDINWKHTDKLVRLLRDNYKNSARTQISIIKETKTFLQFMKDRGYELEIPWFPEIEYTKKEIRVYSPEDLFLIQKRINFLMKNAKGRDVFLRTQLRVVTMAMHTGMRGGEIGNLLIENISIQQRCIYLRENQDWTIKGRREDKPIPVNSTLLTFLVHDLSHRSPHERWFLDNGEGKRAYTDRTSISRAIKKHAIAIGIPPSNLPKPVHGIRAAFATMMSDNKVDLVTIQKLMRHRDITTTRGYVNTERKELQEAVETLDT